MDEEWARLDKKRDEIAQGEQLQQKEWASLKQEVDELNNIKKQVREDKTRNKEDKVRNEEERKFIDQQIEVIS